MITLTAFRSVPPFARGLVRDFRVRWALEEVGIPYREEADRTRGSGKPRIPSAATVWPGAGRFTAGDLLMTTVLRMLRHTDIVSGRPALKAYQERCKTRPTFQKAIMNHLKPFEASAA